MSVTETVLQPDRGLAVLTSAARKRGKQGLVPTIRKLWENALQQSSRARYAAIRAKWDMFLPQFKPRATIWKNRAMFHMDIKLALFIAKNSPCAPSHLTTCLSALRTSLANNGVRLPTLKSGELFLATRMYRGFMTLYSKSPDKRGAALLHLWPSPSRSKMSSLELATIMVTFHCAARGKSIRAWEINHTTVIMKDGAHITLAFSNQKVWNFMLTRNPYPSQVAGLLLKLPCKTMRKGSFFLPALPFLQKTNYAYFDPMWGVRVLFRSMWINGKWRRKVVIPTQLTPLKIARALRKWGNSQNGSVFSHHSLRIGWRTAVTILGLEESIVTRVGRWSIRSVSEVYLRLPPLIILQKLRTLWKKFFRRILK